MIRFQRSIIGMIHVGALPGTPGYGGNLATVVEQAVAEARCYRDNGIDMLAIENMHDIPYLNRKVGPEITAAMAIIGQAVKSASGLPCGVQILAGANCDALAVALAADLDFVRAEGFVFGHMADEGLIQSDAGQLLRYRKQIGAEHIAVLTDIKKKHSAHALTADVSLVETAHAADFFKSDGLIVTGTATGVQTDLDELRAVRGAVSLPLLVGSGVTLDNVSDYLTIADALIIGSWFKKDGHWTNPVDGERVRIFMEKVASLPTP